MCAARGGFFVALSLQRIGRSSLQLQRPDKNFEM